MQQVRFTVGHPFPEDLAARAIGAREVAEFTDRVDLTGWPPGSRVIVRREIPPPGAQLRFTDVHGYRYQVCLTNLDSPDIAFLEALYRGRGRCAQAIRDLKATGLAHRPSAGFACNPAGLTAVVLAGALLAWTGGHLLTGALRRATAPGRRYARLHKAVRPATPVRIPRPWPWAEALRGAVARCARLPAGAP